MLLIDVEEVSRKEWRSEIDGRIEGQSMQIIPKKKE